MATKLVVVKIEAGIAPIYGKQLSGRCHPCNSRFLWDKKLGKLKDMRCPFCNSRLRLTTYQFKRGTNYRLEYPNERSRQEVHCGRNHS